MSVSKLLTQYFLSIKSLNYFIRIYQMLILLLKCLKIILVCMVDIYIVYLFILPKFKFLGDFVLGIVET